MQLTDNVAHLEWRAIDDMVARGHSSRALAKVAAMLREDPDDWKAAMFAMSVMEQRKFPLPVAPPIRHPSGEELTAARLSPDGRRIVTASYDRTARLWHSATSMPCGPPLVHEGPVMWAEFHPEGRLLATCSQDKSVRLWNAETGESIGEPYWHEEGVRNVLFSPDGQQLLTLDFRGPRLWDAATCHPLTVQLPQTMYGGTGFQSSTGRPKFMPDGKGLLVASDCNQARLWHITTPPPGAPTWFHEFIEAVAGLRFAQEVDRPETVPMQRFLELQQRIQDAPEDDFYTAWARPVAGAISG